MQAELPDDLRGDGSESARLPPPPAPAPPLLARPQVVLASRGFWKFLAVCFLTVNLKSIFRHLDATLPKYQLRYAYPQEG